MVFLEDLTDVLCHDYVSHGFAEGKLERHLGCEGAHMWMNSSIYSGFSNFAYGNLCIS